MIIGMTYDNKDLKRPGIYLISSTIDDRCYVGSTVDILGRWGWHKKDMRNGRHPNPKLQNFYNKHGLGCLEFSVLEFCEKEGLIDKEQFYLDSVKPQFNIRKKAGSNLGVKMSEESNRKRREAYFRKRWKPPSFKGRKHSRETKEKLRKAFLGTKLTQETKDKIRKALIGKPRPYARHPLSEETKAKIVEARKGYRHTEETKRKIREGNLGKSHSEETRAKISKSLKGNVISKETREKISKANFGQKRSEQALANMRTAQQLRHRKARGET